MENLLKKTMNSHESAENLLKETPDLGASAGALGQEPADLADKGAFLGQVGLHFPRSNIPGDREGERLDDSRRSP